MRNSTTKGRSSWSCSPHRFFAVEKEVVRVVSKQRRRGTPQEKEDQVSAIALENDGEEDQGKRDAEKTDSTILFLPMMAGGSDQERKPCGNQDMA